VTSRAAGDAELPQELRYALADYCSAYEDLGMARRAHPGSGEREAAGRRIAETSNALHAALAVYVSRCERDARHRVVMDACRAIVDRWPDSPHALDAARVVRALSSPTQETT
jgi:hypothetical protein